MRRVLSILAILVLLAPGLYPATKRSTAKKPTVSTKSNASVKATGKKNSRKSSGKRGTSRTAQRRSGPPRQNAPTPQRYMEIQQALVDKGYYTGDVDGTWDADCVTALKRFQQDQNLAPDGKLGALSLIALGLGPKRDPMQSQLDAKPAAAETP